MQRVRGIGFIPVAVYYDFLLKSDSELSLCYVYDRKREREAQRQRDTTCTCVERSCYNLSPLNFLIPHPFTHPATTSSFLRESPRGIAI